MYVFSDDPKWIMNGSRFPAVRIGHYWCVRRHKLNVTGVLVYHEDDTVNNDGMWTNTNDVF